MIKHMDEMLKLWAEDLHSPQPVGGTAGGNMIAMLMESKGELIRGTRGSRVLLDESVDIELIVNKHLAPELAVVVREHYCNRDSFLSQKYRHCGCSRDLTAFGREIRAAIYKRTGIPVGVGIARTKTLAKLANHTAKRLLDKTGGVVDICDPFKRDWTLRNTDVGEVWGVGKRTKAHLEVMGTNSAMDLAQADAWTLRQKFRLVMEKTARELAGTPCLELSEADPRKR